MTVSTASENHIPFLLRYDRHISEAELRHLISRGRVLIAEEEGNLCGWLRWNLFWDNTPFMNMLFVLEPYRGNRMGKELTLYWERSMKNMGYDAVMTSTQSDEYAQHFYRKLGYETIGGFTPFGEAYELILAKRM